MEQLLARLITLIAIFIGFFLGAIVGHYEGQASVYAKMLFSTENMMQKIGR